MIDPYDALTTEEKADRAKMLKSQELFDTWESKWGKKKTAITLEKEIKHHILTYSAEPPLRTRIGFVIKGIKIYTLQERFDMIYKTITDVIDGKPLSIPNDLSGEDTIFILTKIHSMGLAE